MVANSSLIQAQSGSVKTDSVPYDKIWPVKSRQKSPAAFFSIAWTDIYGTTIPTLELDKFVNSYDASGDKEIVTQLFLKSLIWGEQKDESPEWVRWNFATENFLPEISLSENPASLLFFIHRTFIATQNFNPVAGDRKWVEWVIKNAPGIPEFFTSKNENDFSSSALAWSQNNQSEWKEAQLMSDSLLGVWKTTYRGDYVSLRDLILKEVAPLFFEIGQTETLLPEFGITREILLSDSDRIIQLVYLNLLSRSAHPREISAIRKIANENSDFNMKILFYSIMTSEEYKYF